jgi:hypothetical protein
MRHPISPKADASVLRAILIVRESARPSWLGGLFVEPSWQRQELVEILDLIYWDRVSIELVCNTAEHPSCPDGLQAVRGLIQSGEIDLVLTNDVTRISRRQVDVIEFLSHCIDCGTRFLSLADRIDTADACWQESLVASLSDCQEGGAA